MRIHNPTFAYQTFQRTFALIFFFTITTSSYGQNYIMDDDQTGFHAGVQISFNTFENYYAILPGYTFDGRLTLGLDVGKTKDMVNFINSTAIRPNVSYLLIKQQEDEYPISLEVNMGYQYNYVTRFDFNARSVQFGLGAYHEIKPLDNVKIIPALLIEGNKTTTGLNPRFDESVFFSYGVQTTIVWNNYYITPKLISFDGVSTVGVKLGMIFSGYDITELDEY